MQQVFIEHLESSRDYTLCRSYDDEQKGLVELILRW